MENNTIITLPSLKIALNADRGLSELIENLFIEEEEYGTIGAFHQVDANLPLSPPSKQSDTKAPSTSYEKVNLFLKFNPTPNLDLPNLQSRRVCIHGRCKHNIQRF
jgi:hypothetical protein